MNILTIFNVMYKHILEKIYNFMKSQKKFTSNIQFFMKSRLTLITFLVDIYIFELDN